MELRDILQKSVVLHKNMTRRNSRKKHPKVYTPKTDKSKHYRPKGQARAITIEVLLVKTEREILSGDYLFGLHYFFKNLKTNFTGDCLAAFQEAYLQKIGFCSRTDVSKHHT